MVGRHGAERSDMRDTRTELLAEAELLIRRRGYSGFSYADLAEGVGIRKASIHHHFPTKSDLAVALLASFDARYDLALADIMRQSPDALERVRAYGRLYLEGLEKGLGCLCAAFAAELDTIPDALRVDLSRFFAKHIAWLEGTLTQGLGDGTIRSSVAPASMARMIVAALEGALMMERVLDGPSGFADSFSALEDTLRPGKPVTI